MKTSLNLDDNIIAIEDIIERIEELEAEQPLKNDDDLAELDKLKAIMEELKGNGGDWEWDGDWYPQMLISEDYFTDYIKELIDDCYEMPKEMNSGSWPYRHITIDYDAAAEEAKHDYSSLDIGGTEFFYR